MSRMKSPRDPVHAREGCRGDLMSVRQQLSKLLLRQGIVYYDGQRNAALQNGRSTLPFVVSRSS